MPKIASNGFGNGLGSKLQEGSSHNESSPRFSRTRRHTDGENPNTSPLLPVTLLIDDKGTVKDLAAVNLGEQLRTGPNYHADLEEVPDSEDERMQDMSDTGMQYLVFTRVWSLP